MYRESCGGLGGVGLIWIPLQAMVREGSYDCGRVSQILACLGNLAANRNIASPDAVVIGGMVHVGRRPHGSMLHLAIGLNCTPNTATNQDGSGCSTWFLGFNDGLTA